MIDYTDYTINRGLTCMEALKKLDNEKTNQTLFVLDDNQRLIGTLTDGDIRRGLIQGLGLDSPISLFCNVDYNSISGEISVREVKRFKTEGIKVLPKLNAARRIERVYDLTRLNSILPLHAVIMAGGRGERLRPLTDSTPKPMLPLGDKPIIEHQIDRLISYGIENVTISLRYKGDQIKDYFGDGSSKGIAINYVSEDNPLGTIGCLSLIKQFKSDNILVLNSDIFTNIDYEAFYLDFENEIADMAVASIPYSVDIPYAIIELENNYITSFKEKPKNTYYANAGIYLIQHKNVSLIPENVFFNATDLMDSIITRKGKLIHSPITGYWIDIGKMDDYNKAKEIIRHI